MPIKIYGCFGDRALPTNILPTHKTMFIFDEWIRYIDKPFEPRDPPWEYELRCRVHVIGEINMGWLRFRFWDMPPTMHQSEVRSVVLRMQHRPADMQEYLKIPNKKDQYYHPTGPAGEFESLLTLFTRTHFALTRGTFTGDLPLITRFSAPRYVAYCDFDGQAVDLGDIQGRFEALLDIRRSERDRINRHLPVDRFVKRFVMAARFYHLALSLIGHDDTLSYLCLVSSIECMITSDVSGNYGLREINPEAHQLIESFVPDQDARRQIEQAILKHEPMIKFRFSEFITSHVGESFWNDGTRPEEMYRFKDEQEILLFVKRVYDARSDAIHDGIPFPKSLTNNEEKPLHGAMQIGQKKWSEKELLPSVRAFERLVHHVLVGALTDAHNKVK